MGEGGGEGGSAAQTQWAEIAEAVRGALAKRVPLLPGMSVTDCKDFLEALALARSFEIDCLTFDGALASHRRELEGAGRGGDTDSE